jgi:hypothetical protein
MLHVRRYRDGLIWVSLATRPTPRQSTPSNGLYIISHSPHIQGELDRLGIPWGAQYELARGESRGQWTWGEVTGADLELLVGLNAEAAPKVFNLMLRTQRSELVDDIVWCVWFMHSLSLVPSMTHDTGQSTTESRMQSLRTTNRGGIWDSTVIGHPGAAAQQKIGMVGGSPNAHASLKILASSEYVWMPRSTSGTPLASPDS